MTDGPRRRDFLAGTVLGAAVPLSGCNADDPEIGGTDSDGDSTDADSGSTDTDSGGDSAGGRYDPPIPAPGVVANDYSWRSFLYRQPSALASRSDDLGDAYSRVKHTPRYWGRLAKTGLRFEELEDMFVTYLGLNVFEGEFDRKVVEYELHESGMEPRGSRNGYDRWADPDGDTAVALYDGTVVLVDAKRIESDRFELVDAVVDAERGDVERYAEVDDDLDLLLDRFGPGEYVSSSLHHAHQTTNVAEGQFEGKVGGGARKRIEGDYSDHRVVFLFETAESVDPSKVEAYYEDRVDDWSDGTAESLAVERQGRTAVISWTTPLEYFV